MAASSQAVNALSVNVSECQRVSTVAPVASAWLGWMLPVFVTVVAWEILKALWNVVKSRCRYRLSIRLMPTEAPIPRSTRRALDALASRDSARVPDTLAMGDLDLRTQSSG